jgi:hypothetical protein
MGVPAVIDNYLGKKMGNFLTDVVSNLNPVQLSKGVNAQKGVDVGGNLKAIRDLTKNKTEPGMSLKDYFRGKKVGAKLPTDSRQPTSFNRFVSEEKDAARGTTRAIGAGAIAAYGLAPMVLGKDNPISRTIEGGAALGVHAGVTASALRTGPAGKYFGVGYAGLAAVNAVRSGNNWGPF